MMPGVEVLPLLDQEAGGGFTGTELDFVADPPSLVVEGVSYVLDDLFDIGDGADVGDVYDPDAIEPGRGWLCTWFNNNAPSVKAGSPLEALFLQPGTWTIEWEDIEEFSYEYGTYWSPSEIDIYANIISDLLQIVLSGGAVTFAIDSPYVYRRSGVNKTSWTIASATGTNASINGQALVDPSGDTSTFFPEEFGPYEIYPFGTSLGSGPITGWVRKLTFVPEAADTTLAVKSALTTPGFITGYSAAAASATSIQLTFTAATGADSYEYWIKPTAAPGPDYPQANNTPVPYDWQPLDPSKLITGLTTGTQYNVLVRPVNTDGPGRAQTTSFVTTP